jgi:hypothetical protein
MIGIKLAERAKSRYIVDDTESRCGAALQGIECPPKQNDYIDH